MPLIDFRAICHRRESHPGNGMALLLSPQWPWKKTSLSLDLGQHRTHRLSDHIYQLTKRMSNTEVVNELARYQC
jgi:hypothetical protein